MTSSSKVDLYKESGVDVKKGEELVEWLQESQSQADSIVSGIGGFAALFRPDFSQYKDPLLVSGADGVGTKLLLGIEHELLEGLGIDLVAMCVNDLYTLGATPLFFLDYFATGKLETEQFKAILTGIKKGLEQCNTALLGGETAELPGLYGDKHFDLAGFVVGVVDKDKTLGAQNVKIDDKLYAFPSTGFHSNGFSLIRKWLKSSDQSMQSKLIEKIMTPTKIYSEVPKIMQMMGFEGIHAIANITGGGISGNLPRVMPDNVTCSLDWNAIRCPQWMSDFIKDYETDLKSLEKTFNLGIGMILSIDKDHTKKFEQSCAEVGIETYQIGEVREAKQERIHYQ
ncbi:MAG: phosphoribosylformylglycinamidine cyclo-ligase [Bdellovibrionota bacterium]